MTLIDILIITIIIRESQEKKSLQYLYSTIFYSMEIGKVSNYFL